MTRRPFHKPEAVELVEVLAFVPVTARKGWRIARVRQGGIEFAELRACSFDPQWEPSAGDHRSVIRGPALRRVIAALEALETKMEGAS